MTDQIGNVLLDLGLISPEQLGSAIKLQQKKNERLGELLFQLKYISETDILKVLAERFRIHYITSEKLSNIRIPRMVLDMIPLEYAEAKHVLPILFDQERSVLSVLAAAPTDPKLLKEIQLLAQCQEVNAYLALKPAIEAGIRKFYLNDPRAFEQIEHGNMVESLSVYVSENNLSATQVPEIQDQNPNLRLSDEVQAGSLMSQNLYIETLNILISLLEMRRGGAFRGHSASVARLAKRMAEEMDLPPDEIYFLVVAAYFHDLGKKDGVHPTLINLHTEKDLELAQKFYMAPVRLIEHIPFPPQVLQSLTHMFERMDGKGFPNGLAEDEIPLTSRILAVVEGYEDLIRNPEWSDKPIQAILQELMHYKGTCFDENVLNTLYDVVMEGQGEAAQAGGEGNTILMIDSIASFGFLVARLREVGYRVLIAKDTDTAVNLVKEGGVNMILSEVASQPLHGFQLCKAMKQNQTYKDIFFLFLSSKEESPRLIHQGFDAGADDFFTRPLRVEVILAKVKRLFASKRETKVEETQAPKAAVVGSLKDVALPDMLQLLTTSRKRGMLHVKSGELEARVFLDSGMITECLFGDLNGVEAFNKVIMWSEGEFALETEVEMPPQTITIPPSNLILDAYRIADEDNADSFDNW